MFAVFLFIRCMTCAMYQFHTALSHFQYMEMSIVFLMLSVFLSCTPFAKILCMHNVNFENGSITFTLHIYTHTYISFVFTTHLMLF